ncbi:HDOD domain-containing protein [Psychrobacillus sp. FSL K6-4046]|uniref:EAL and HDOD domain-containing protein n=1 Tax=Psychrobacillus sp. FSL K6-4046 TaxID=2921550 RepID=UPI003159BEB4
MEIFIARQPIFNMNESLYGYELLYRNNEDNSFPDVDADMATIDVLTHSFLTIGINEIAGDKLCFINFTENLLDKAVLRKFPSNRIVVEILENITITPRLIKQIRQIKAMGFLLALDDFVLKQNVDYYDELFSLVSFIKIDFLATTVEERKSVEKIVQTNYPNIVLLAEKVETREDFYEAKSAGYKLFQGYFFAKPEIIKATDIPANVVQYIRLINLLRKEEASMDEIALEIERDVSLTFKVLKMVNSPVARPRSKVRSIKQGVLMLGLEEINHWLHVLLLREVHQNYKGDGLAIVEASLFRAKFCELLAKQKNLTNSSEYLLVGMFSLMDTILHKKMDQLVKELPLSDDVAATLVGSSTEMTPFLDLTIAYDEVRWNDMLEGANNLEIDFPSLNNFYKEARKWATDIVTQ